MPPKSALERVAQLVDLQVQYLQTAGNASAALPDFLGCECLHKSSSGEVEYNFGTEASEAPITLNSMARKRQQTQTPQKGARRKKQLTSTPKK